MTQNRVTALQESKRKNLIKEEGVRNNILITRKKRGKIRITYSWYMTIFTVGKQQFLNMPRRTTMQIASLLWPVACTAFFRIIS
jgi:hypothetical protein